MLPAIIYILLSVFALFFAIFHFFGNRELYYKTSNIRGPLSFPLIGSGYLFLGDSGYILERLFKLCNVYPSPFRLILGPRVMAVIHDPEQIKTTLLSSKTAEKDDSYRFIKPWLGNGLVTAPYSIWRVHRKLIQPAFIPKILQSFVQIFQKNSLLSTQAMAVEVDGKEFELSSYVSLPAFSNICESSLGVSVEAEKTKIEEYLVRTQIVLELLVYRMFRVWLHPDNIFNLTQSSKIFYDCIEHLKGFTDDIIRKRRKYLQNESIENIEGTEDRKKPFLDLLLEMANNEDKFTDEEIREHVDTMMSAGHDTVTRTNAFILFMLSNHPHIQDKVYEEIYNIYGAEDPAINPVKFEDLKEMQYLERVIKETMRLFPVVPILGRSVIEDFVLDGCTFPKGCGIFIYTLRLHRDEKIWQNPLKFDPDRFLPEEIAKRHPCSFIPFSYGSRDCIGRVYAMMSMKILIATILRKYIIKRDKIIKIEDIKIKGDVLLFTADPITVKIEKRVK